MVSYQHESPLITGDIDWSTILGNVPRTNVGMVPFQYEGWDQGVPQLGIDPDDVIKTGYVQPRDERVKDLLGYSLDQTYDRPEELEFARDPNDPTPGVVNTELNPFDPSSKFFPWEQDYSGIMAATALKEGADPIYDISHMDPEADFSNIPPSLRSSEYVRPESEERFGVQQTWPPADAPTKFDVGLNVPKLEKEKGYIDSTLLHEARHYYQNKYGFDIDRLPEGEMHNLIYQFQGMYYNNPVDVNAMPNVLNKREAGAFMKMHKQGKEWYQSQGQGFPETKHEKMSRGSNWHDLMMAGQKELGHTRDQRINQFDRMYGIGSGRDWRGDYTRPTMTQQQMAQDARLTGGGVNPHEATRARYETRPLSPHIGENISPPREEPGRHHFNTGGIVSLML